MRYGIEMELRGGIYLPIRGDIQNAEVRYRERDQERGGTPPESNQKGGKKNTPLVALPRSVLSRSLSRSSFFFFLPVASVWRRVFFFPTLPHSRLLILTKHRNINLVFGACI